MCGFAASTLAATSITHSNLRVNLCCTVGNVGSVLHCGKCRNVWNENADISGLAASILIL